MYYGHCQILQALSSFDDAAIREPWMLYHWHKEHCHFDTLYLSQLLFSTGVCEHEGGGVEGKQHTVANFFHLLFSTGVCEHEEASEGKQRALCVLPIARPNFF
jgi:hypothetical protein